MESKLHCTGKSGFPGLEGMCEMLEGTQYSVICKTLKLLGWGRHLYINTLRFVSGADDPRPDSGISYTAIFCGLGSRCVSLPAGDGPSITIKCIFPWETLGFAVISNWLCDI